ncbi:hypothetical protein JCM33374_g2325 [Metschnikowia sp. JCM 33374]|nr:hypothetical protein JCM33374_g2325 [Metschnikowia sp. JCM 33374]
MLSVHWGYNDTHQLALSFSAEDSVGLDLETLPLQLSRSRGLYKISRVCIKEGKISKHVQAHALTSEKDLQLGLFNFSEDYRGASLINHQLGTFLKMDRRLVLNHWAAKWKGGC